MNNSDAAMPRLMMWDNTITDKQEMIMVLEAQAKDKVKKIYPYQPKPQYLILYAEIVSGSNGYKQRLILHLSPSRTGKMDDSLTKIKCFRKSVYAELKYEIIRSTCHNMVEEMNGHSLYFEEFRLNSKGENFSIIMILKGIYHAATSSIFDTQFQKLIDAWAN